MARPSAADSLGAHVSTAGGVERAPGRARALSTSAMQIFTRNQRQWSARPIPASSAASFREQMAACRVSAAISHASYLINLAGKGEILKRSREVLLDEWDRAEQLGLLGVCLHPGAHLGAGPERGIQRIVASLNRTERRRPRHRSLILIENTAGQGTSLGWSFDELEAIFSGLERPARFGLCVDTCHLFAAGYDLRDASSYRRTFRRLDETLGIDRIRAFHLNDSKADHGSRVDRHEQIGKGKLGSDTFRRLVRDRRFRTIPKILETPGGDPGYRRALRLVRGFLR